MSAFQSSNFMSLCLRGKDWRDVTRRALHALEEIDFDSSKANLGFVYVTRALADDFGSIVNLLRTVSGVPDWMGAVGFGVCGVDESVLDEAAISVMVGTFEDGVYQLFSQKPKGDVVLSGDGLSYAITHMTPSSHLDLLQELHFFDEQHDVYQVGGLGLAENAAGSVYDRGVGGVVFSPDVEVSTFLTQGCKPFGQSYSITRVDENCILELDGQPALDVFEEELRHFITDLSGVAKDQDVAPETPPMALALQHLTGGRVHIGFSVPDSDQGDFMVRQIVDLDVEEGSVSVSHHPVSGERVFFVRRDQETMLEDLSRRLVELRKRVERERGVFAPMAAHYISCAGRYDKEAEVGGGVQSSEMQVLRDIIGDIPLTGFYAGGEISNGRLYSFTGVLTLFF